MSNGKNKNAIKKRLAKEYLKCAQDPVYFMKKYCIITHQKKGKIKFNLFDFQERALHEIAENRFNVILKARQMGISTLTAGYALWLALFNDDKKILVVSMKRDIAKNLVDKARGMHDNLPSWLRETKTVDNKLSFEFSNGSKIFAESTSADAGRSESLSLLIIDEAAFIRDVEELWSAAKLTLDVGKGHAIVLSTPKGVGEWFYDIWTDAVVGPEKISEKPEMWEGTGKNDFHPIKLHWTLHPERDEAWRLEQDKVLGPRKAARECFDGETKIHTKYGLKKIKNVSVGDLILTHTGNYKKVVRKFSKKSDDIYSISSSLNTKKSYVTGNHPFLNLNGEWQNASSLNNKQKLPCFPLNIDNSQYLSDNTIDLYERLDVSPYSYVLSENEDRIHLSDKHEVLHNRYIEVDYDLGYFVGLYLAKGYSCDLRLDFSFDYTKELYTWPQQLINIVKDKFNLDNYQIRNQKNTGHLTFCSKLIVGFVNELVTGNTANHKGLSEYCHEIASIEFYRGIIDGVMMGDGCLTNTANKSLNTVSEKLVDDIIHISSVLGYPLVSRKFKENEKTEVIFGREVNTHEVSFLNTARKSCNLITEILNTDIPKKNKAGHVYRDDDYLVSRLNIEKTNLELDVYNIEVEGDHTYVTEHFVVHNCDCNFETSGNTVIEPELLKWYLDNQQKDPVEKRFVMGSRDLWIWEEPEPNVNYILSADVARGDAGDFSTMQIYDAKTIDQKAEYQGKIPIDQFAKLIHTTGINYNNALVVVERNNLGWAVLQKLHNNGYRNLLWTSNNLEFVDVTQTNYSQHQKKLKPGLNVSRKTRPLIISKLTEYIRNKYCTIKSVRTLNELQTFVWKNDKAVHMNGKNDDLILALAFTFWVRDTALRLNAQASQLTQKTLNNISSAGSGGIYTPGGLGEDPYEVDCGYGKEDLRWLL